MIAFEERKRALAAESELFRQTLRWEWRNVRFRAAYNRQKYARVPLPSWLIFLLPLAGTWVRGDQRRGALPRFARAALVAIQFYKKLAPLAGLWLLRRKSRRWWTNSFSEPSVAANVATNF